VFDETGDAAKAQGWTALVLDTDGNGQRDTLVMPDDIPAHPYQTAVDIASLAPNAEVTVFPWREPPELTERTINRARTFLKARQPVRATR
jgi:hypothetical protein